MRSVNPMRGEWLHTNIENLVHLRLIQIGYIKTTNKEYLLHRATWTTASSLS